VIFLNNLTTYKKTIIIACIASIALGILLHFAYDWTYENKIVGLVAPVNESVWEHLKLILIPFTIFSIVFYFYTKQKFSNMLLATFLGNVVGMFVTVVLYYLGTMLFGNENMVFNIITFVVGVIASYTVLYLSIYNTEFLEETKDSTLVGACALSLLVAVFIIGTVYPIKMELTRDPKSSTYGIFEDV